MKILRRNEQTDNRGNLSGAELKHMKAVSLIEELDDRSKRRPRVDAKGRNKSELQQALNPKRLLCFSNKAKKDQDPEENQRKSDWKSRNIIDYKAGQILTIKDRRKNNGELSALCNELCQDYYEIRKKLKNRPVVTNPKKVQVLDAAIAGSNSTTSSSIDAPLRNFGVKKSEKSNVHYSNENRELHRRQRSLLDDGSVHREKNKSSNKSTSKKSNQTRSSRSSSRKTNSIQSKSNRSKNSKRSDKSKSKSRKSNSLKANSRRSHRGRPTQPEMSMSESTADTIPVSVIERNSRGSGIHPDMSMISTMTSKSYSTYTDSSIILSPRGANDKVDKNLNQGQGGLLVCSSAAPCTSRPQRSGHHISRNPSNVQVDLGTIAEGDYYYTSSASSGSFSSYSSSSSCSYSDYSDSSSDLEDDGARRKNKKNIGTGCSTVARSDVWNAIMYDENTIEERDDHYRSIR
eukprot:CAMPEP_0116145930 /NCGR_PEP_ID=MMETSP0329-20121206/16888_1 /TAXON_ID=697910 /ORGANISM="Pseudo-nitzschia arenysensis, Strain B593" /LENGTH=459 /DNA_ID=CAMNT_0003641633 /DNA_START=8 /DNA_END=1390 /DNA_ORIENTATION=-